MTQPQIIPKATHTGELGIAGTVIFCAVLEDETRVLTQETFLKAIGRAGKAKAGTGSVKLVDGVPPFLAARNLRPFISDNLRESTAPIVYRPLYGGKAYGYKAELLPMVCQVYLDAKRAGKTLANQEHIVMACEMLLGGLATIGIIGLVDEATGFQVVRSRHALEEILDRYISKELLKWTKTFPDEFYEELFRLRGWQYSPFTVKRPSYVGTLTNDVVYERLAPGVLEELKRITPKDDKGRRKYRYHQRLTQDIGHPKLRDHISGTIALMRATPDWRSFQRLLQRAFPKINTSLELPFDDL